MSLCSLLLLLALCLMSSNGTKCYVGKGKDVKKDQGCEDSHCGATFNRSGFIDAYCQCWLSTGCGPEKKTYYLAEFNVSVSCCHADIDHNCNEPTPTELKCWTGNNRKGFTPSTSCLALYRPKAKFCRTLIGHTGIVADCGSTFHEERPGWYEIVEGCKENGCTDIWTSTGDRGKQCCCDTDNCNDPNKYTTTTTNKYTTTTTNKYTTTTTKASRTKTAATSTNATTTSISSLTTTTKSAPIVKVASTRTLFYVTVIFVLCY